MGTLSTMPFCPPRQIVEFEIDAQGANYDSIAKGAKKICADYKNCELHLKFFNLSPVYDVGESQESQDDTPKKSEMACNCCGDCEEETEKMETISRTIDILIAEMEKLANQKKF